MTGDKGADIFKNTVRCGNVAQGEQIAESGLTDRLGNQPGAGDGGGLAGDEKEAVSRAVIQRHTAKVVAGKISAALCGIKDRDSKLAFKLGEQPVTIFAVGGEDILFAAGTGKSAVRIAVNAAAEKAQQCAVTPDPAAFAELSERGGAAAESQRVIAELFRPGGITEIYKVIVHKCHFQNSVFG